MRAVAKRFLVGKSATAQGDRGTTRHVEQFSGSILECEIAFHEHWPIIVHRHFRHAILLHKICSGLSIRYRLRHNFQEVCEYAGEKPNLARHSNLHIAAGTGPLGSSLTFVV